MAVGKGHVNRWERWRCETPSWWLKLMIKTVDFEPHTSVLDREIARIDDCIRPACCSIFYKWLNKAMFLVGRNALFRLRLFSNDTRGGRGLWLCYFAVCFGCMSSS